MTLMLTYNFIFFMPLIIDINKVWIEKEIIETARMRKKNFDSKPIDKYSEIISLKRKIMVEKINEKNRWILKPEERIFFNSNSDSWNSEVYLIIPFSIPNPLITLLSLRKWDN